MVRLSVIVEKPGHQAERDNDRLTAVIGALTLAEGRFQTKDHLTGHRPQRTPGRLRELPMQRLVTADSKLAAGCRFLLRHSHLRRVRTLCGISERRGVPQKLFGGTE